ncbi:E3 ubiquitin-protein ligase PDZRN3-like [Branchiostoma lanceolatum]|uniref:E3 ubiquitin-protein ligase PDZRN3-like n=1 Tax=Branchiostoma lanceolatum TaxID=7740 RepID=UPI0034549A30
MGKFELEMFDPPPDQEFICSICRCVMEDPQECPCGHVFCKECIQQWLRSHSNCPNCRKQCYQVKPVLPMVRNLINHLTIRCENHQAGCDKKVQLEYYDNHKKVCDYASVPCPNEGCDLHVLRINMDKHNSVCDYHRDTCVKGCGISILRKEQKGHSCILELKKKLEEQEQEKRSLKQKNEELQAKVDNLKFLCWRSRNYLKKNVHPEAPRTVHNLCIDLENATGLAPDNTEGHRDAAIPQAAPVQRDEGESSSHEGIPLPAMDMPQGTPSSYQPSPDSSPLRAIDFPEGTPSSYQPSPDSSPLRAIDFPDGTPSSYQPSPDSSPLRAIDFPEGTPSSYQPSPDRDAGSSPSQHQPSPAREVHTSMFAWSSPSQYQPSPDRDVGSSPSQYQPSPDRVEEGRDLNGDTVEDNAEAVEGGQAQPPGENRNSTEETEQHNQRRDSTQANSNVDNGSRDDDSAVESDSIRSDSEVELSDHTANLRYLVSSDSDPTWDEDSPNISDSEGEDSDTDNSEPVDDIRESMNVAQRSRTTRLVPYDGGFRLAFSENEEGAPSNATVQNNLTHQNSQSRSETTVAQRAQVSTSNTRVLRAGGGLIFRGGGGLRVDTHEDEESPRSPSNGTVQNRSGSTTAARRAAGSRLLRSYGGGWRPRFRRDELNEEEEEEPSSNGTVQNSSGLTQQNRQSRRGFYFEPDSDEPNVEPPSNATVQNSSISGSTQQNRQSRRGFYFEPDEPNEEEPPRNATVQNSSGSTQQNSQNRSETAEERAPAERSHQDNTNASSHRAEGTVLVEESEEMGDDEDGSTAETIESDVLGHLSDVEQGRTQQVTSQEGFSGSQRPNRNRSAGVLVRVRGTPLVVRNSRNRQRGQRLQRSRASQRQDQGQGNARGRGASRPQEGSARSECSSTRQTVVQARRRHSNTTPPVITIGSSDGNQSPNQQRADTQSSRTRREGGASQQQRDSVQRTQRNQSASRDIVEINIPGAEEVTARESRRRRGARALRRVAAAQGRSAAAQRRDATAQRRRPTAARSTRRSGASSRPLDSGESDSESVPVAPKRPRRHKGGRN